MKGTSYTVRISSEIDDPGEWDKIVAAAEAPLFLRAEVLQAYQSHPLRDILGSFYVTVTGAGGETAAVLPVYLQPANDPLGLLPRLLPGFQPGGRPLLLTHVWHWYDTHLPARELDTDLLGAVCEALRGLAGTTGAQALGFMNVAQDGQLARLLPLAGFAPEPIDARYVLDLAPFRTIDDYLMHLRPRPRQEIKRHLRRAFACGAEVTVGPPSSHDMATVAQLCRITSAKHGNPDWYLPDRLCSFVMACRDRTRLVAIRIDGRIVAASISFTDGWRFHNWAAGTVALDRLEFSPYLVLMRATIDTALREGCTMLEGGRRNDGWKERLGLRRVNLLGCLA